MEKEKIESVRTRFKKELEALTDADKVFSRFNAYFKWLKECQKENIALRESRELYNLLCAEEFKLVFLFQQHIERFGLKHNTSNHWNKRLVARILEYCEDYKELKGSKQFETKATLLFDSLLEETDIATVAFCFKILSDRNIVPLVSVIQQFECSGVKLHTPINGIERKLIDGSTYIDDGSKYWHATAKELMTYDECIERKLQPWLLIKVLPNGRLDVGFTPFAAPSDSDIKSKYVDVSTEENLKAVKRLLSEDAAQTTVASTTVTE